MWLVVFVVATAAGGAGGLGFVLAFGALVANTPQVLVAYRERDLTGLSPSTWALTACDGTVWFLYGIITGDIPILVNNFFQATTGAAIAIRRLAWGRRQLQLES
jgi:MtN3 and saliva related transmembrane protein